MAATYTTAALVKKRIENIDASLADGDIEAHINEAEQILNAVMGTDFLGTDHTFDVSKHGILRAAANAYAAYTAVLFNPAGFTNTSEAFGIADGLWQQWEFLVGLLSNRSIVEELESL